jgi:SAM-dependent methyltransferase
MTVTGYGTDMVRAARTALAPLGGRASAQQADAAALPFASNRFGLVVSAAMLHHVVAWENVLAEAIRVLHPGGWLIGYDLLGTAPVRLLHLGGGHDTRLLRPGQLEGELDRLGVTGVRAATGLGGLVIKFTAVKATAPSTSS